ncbi:MAG: hypothetical protein J6X12_02665 [Paludibacteraceae bacterium]|nr:hypothetical protein [Paludibacteraceae bacterium]
MIITFNIRRIYLLGFLLSMFALTSCSQKVAETNDVADDATIADADSIAHVDTVPTEANVVDIAESDSVVLGNVIVVADSLIHKKRLEFKISTPPEGYEYYKEKDSIICSLNNWSYSPDAVYVVNISEIQVVKDCDCEDEFAVAYRNGIKVMESYEYFWEDGNGSHDIKYYNPDGSVADEDGVMIVCLDTTEINKFKDWIIGPQ